MDAIIDKELIAAMLYESDDVKRFDRIAAFVNRFKASTVAVGLELLASRSTPKRVLGADLLGQGATVLGTTSQEARAALRNRLRAERNPDALSSVIVALGHIGDEASRDAIIGAADHPDADVRHAVAFALSCFELTPEAIRSLATLSRDPDANVRDWATFALAESGEDSQEVREALRASAEDSDPDTRAEGIFGLARRRDPEAPSLVTRELSRKSHGTLIDRANEMLT